jgi:RNA polymerase sigma factor (sigma-70 family)
MALLMRQALDEGQFDELVGRTLRPLYAYVVTVLLDDAAAEDVTQRAFELAYARRRSFRPERGSAEAWLFGIARHVALDERRDQQRRPVPSSDAESWDCGAPGAGDCRAPGAWDCGAWDVELERVEQRDALLAALATLDRSERELIALKMWGDLSYREIAALVGCSESNVGTRLSRAIAKLRENLR